MKIKKTITICISILLLTIVSCNSNKDKAKKTVNNFFINLNGNKNSVTIDKIFTEDYEKFISKNYSFVSRDWILNDISENDSVIIIEYKSKGENSLRAIDMIQTFYLKKVKGEFLIFDSENVVTNSMNFEVIGLDKKSLTDMQKNMIFENIKKNISIKILEKGRKSIFSIPLEDL